MNPVLEVEGLTFGYDSAAPVLRDISFAVEAGECLAIVGANGAGKSTLLWCLLGLLKARGSVRLFGEKPSGKTLARVAMVFQNPEDQLFMPRLEDDVALSLLNRGVPPEAARARALEALDEVALKEARHRPASQLSLGERKRASIAAALAAAPELLLLDEPTAELDGRSVRQLVSLLRGLKVARLITSHDLDFLRQVSSRILVLLAGRIIAGGPTEEILSHTELLENAGLI